MKSGKVLGILFEFFVSFCKFFISFCKFFISFCKFFISFYQFLISFYKIFISFYNFNTSKLTEVRCRRPCTSCATALKIIYGKCGKPCNDHRKSWNRCWEKLLCCKSAAITFLFFNRIPDSINHFK